MVTDLIDSLPLVQRLALSYAPRRARGATLALLALDTRLAGIVRGASEPMIAQMKLAWWRERLSEKPAGWPEGEPLLALLREWPGNVAALVALVDGWEALLAEEFDEAAMASFSEGRADAWRALGDGLGVHEVSLINAWDAAHRWALHDLLLHLQSDELRSNLATLLETKKWPRVGLDPKFRALAVLHGLSRRAWRRNAEKLLDGPGAMLTAMRLGFVGR